MESNFQSLTLKVVQLHTRGLRFHPLCPGLRHTRLPRSVKLLMHLRHWTHTYSCGVRCRHCPGRSLGTTPIESPVGRRPGTLTNFARRSLNGVDQHAFAPTAATRNARCYALRRFFAWHAFHGRDLSGVLTGLMGWARCQCLYWISGLWTLANAGVCTRPSHTAGRWGGEHWLTGKPTSRGLLAPKL